MNNARVRPPPSDHNSFTILYFRFVEGLRPDVTIADGYGYIDPPIYERSSLARGKPQSHFRTKGFRRAVESWIVSDWKRPVYFSHKKSLHRDGRTYMEPEGLWYRATRSKTKPGDVARRRDVAWSKIADITETDAPEPYDYSAHVVLSDIGFARARRMFARNENDEAVAICHRASEHSSESKEVLNNFGSLLAENECLTEAAGYVRRARDIDPDYLMATRNLGITLRAAGRIAEAVEVFNSLVRRNENDPVAIRELAEIARSRSDWPAAVRYFTHLGRITQDAKAFRDAGLIALYELRDFKRAKSLLGASLDIDPNQRELRDIEKNIKATYVLCRSPLMQQQDHSNARAQMSVRPLVALRVLRRSRCRWQRWRRFAMPRPVFRLRRERVPGCLRTTAPTRSSSSSPCLAHSFDRGTGCRRPVMRRWLLLLVTLCCSCAAPDGLLPPPARVSVVAGESS